MPTSTSPNEGDVLFNQASIAAAKSLRLLRSWLPPRTSEELVNTKTEQQIDEEEAEIFKPELDTAGLGLSLPVSGSLATSGTLGRGAPNSNEKLRKQLLGKNAKQGKMGHRSVDARRGGNRDMPSKPKPAPIAQGSESEEEGRSSLGKLKRQKKQRVLNAVEVNDDQIPELEDIDIVARVSAKPLQLSRASKQKTTSYLDEVLAERSMRKKKKRKRTTGSSTD